MENVKKLVTERFNSLKEEIDKVGKKKADDNLLKEFYELQDFLNSYDLLHLVINSRNEARNQGYAEGWQEGADYVSTCM